MPETEVVIPDLSIPEVSNEPDYVAIGAQAAEDMRMAQLQAQAEADARAKAAEMVVPEEVHHDDKPWFSSAIFEEPIKGAQKAIIEAGRTVEALFHTARGDEGAYSFTTKDGRTIWYTGTSTPPADYLLGETDSIGAQMTRDTAAILTDLFLLRGAGKAKYGAQALSAKGKFFRNLAQGAIIDGMVFTQNDASLMETLGLIDPSELSNVADTSPMSFFTGKAKHVAEGAVIGGFLDVGFGMLGKTKNSWAKYKAAKNAGEHIVATESARIELEEGISQSVVDGFKSGSREEGEKALQAIKAQADNGDIPAETVRVAEEAFEEAFPDDAYTPILTRSKLREQLRAIRKATNEGLIEQADAVHKQMEDKLLAEVDQLLAAGDEERLSDLLMTFINADKTGVRSSVILKIRNRMAEAAKKAAMEAPQEGKQAIKEITEGMPQYKPEAEPVPKPTKKKTRVTEQTPMDEVMGMLQESEDLLSGKRAAKATDIDLSVTERPLTQAEVARSVDNIAETLDGPPGVYSDDLAKGIPRFTAKEQAGAYEAGIHSIWSAIYKQLQSNPDKYFKPVSLDDMAVRAANLAKRMGEDGKKLVEKFSKVAKRAEELPYMIAAYDSYLKNFTKKLDELATKVASGGASRADIIDYAAMKEELPELINKKKIVATLTGRSMNAFRLQSSLRGRAMLAPTVRRVEAKEAGLRGLTSITTIDKPMMKAGYDLILPGGIVRKVGATSDAALTKAEMEVLRDADEVIRFYGNKEKMAADAAAYLDARKTGNFKELKATPFARKWDTVMAYYVNNFIATPAGAVINTFSNVMQNVALPAYRMIGAATIGAGAKVLGKQELATNMKRVFDEGVSWFMGMKVALQDFKSIWESGLASQHFIKADDKLILQNVGSELRAPGYNPNGWFGKMLTPLRAFGATDEIFQQITYRASAYARAQTQAGDALIAAMKAGDSRVATEGLQKKFVEDYMTGFMKEVMSDPLLFGREFIDKARKSVYQGDLPFFAKPIQTLKSSHPGIAMLISPIFPFVKIPSNIIREQARLTPELAIMEVAWEMACSLLFRSKHKNALIGDLGAEEMAARWGQFVAGVGLALTGAGLYKSGVITGSGPSDPEARKAWLKDNAPNSVRIGDTAIPLGRLDPFFAAMSGQADYMEAFQEFSKEGATKTATTLLLSTLTDFTNQSWAVPAKNTMEIIQGKRSPVSQLDQIASGFIPYQSFGRQLNKAITGTTPDYKELFSGVRSGTAAPFFYAIDLQPNPDADITSGNPVTINFWGAMFPGAGGPISFEASKGVRELARYKILPGSMQIPRTVGGIELTRDQRAKLAKYKSEFTVSGKPMWEYFEDNIISGWGKYQSPDEMSKDATSKSPQFVQTQKYFDGINRAIVNKLINEDPVLFEQVKQDKVAQFYIRRGDAATAADALWMAKEVYGQ